MDKKNEEIKKDLITINITTKGRAKLLDILQDHLGYIEEENHEQILNGIQEWMNANYSQLLDFYVKAVSKGLVPAIQLHEVVEENNALREKLGIGPRKEEVVQPTSDATTEISVKEKESPAEEKTPIVKPSPKKPKDDEKFTPISPDMNGWELRRIAKKLGLPLATGMSKEMIYDMVQEELKGRNKS